MSAFLSSMSLTRRLSWDSKTKWNVSSEKCQTLRAIYSHCDKDGLSSSFYKGGGTENTRLSQRINIAAKTGNIQCEVGRKGQAQNSDSLLSDINNGRTIVFVNYRDSVDRVYFHLKEQGLPVGLYHADWSRLTVKRLYRCSTTALSRFW